MPYKKIFICFTTFLMAFMIFVYLYRLMNNNDNFLGLSDLYFYFQTIDLWKPFRELYESFLKQFNDFNVSTESLTNISNIEQFFSAFGNYFLNLLKLITFPIQALYTIIKWILLLFGEIFRFFAFVGGFSQ